MPHSNYDIPKLAKYLHLTEKEIQKLAERGDLPGRKIQGVWVFSREEIHHWWEQKIGLSDSRELETVEVAIAKNAVEEESPVLLANLIPEGGIEIPLMAKTKDSVLRSMSSLAASTGLLWDADKMADALKKREDLHPTALDNGVALLHPRRPIPSILGETLLLLGISPRGIPFGGGHGNLTDIFFLLCSTDDRIHLRILARLSRLLTLPDFLDELRTKGDAASARSWIEESEEKI